MTIWQMTAMTVHCFTLYNQNLLGYFPNTGPLDTLLAHMINFCVQICIDYRKKKLPQIPQRMTRPEWILLLSLLIQTDFSERLYQFIFPAVEYDTN